MKWIREFQVERLNLLRYRAPVDERSLCQSILLSNVFISCLLFSHLANISQAHRGNPPPHLVIVSSNAHLQALSPERKLEKISSVLNTETSFAGKEFDHRSVSKLSDAYIAVELVNLTPVFDGNPRAIASYVTPVFMKTGMGIEE